MKEKMNNKYTWKEDTARLNNVRIYSRNKEKERFNVNLESFYLKN